MKKILFGILFLFLVALVPSVSSVTGSLIWNTAGTILPTSVTMTEDSVDITSLLDLEQYITDSEAITSITSDGSAHVVVTVSGTTPFDVTLTPATNWHGSETITFKANDVDDLNVESSSVTIVVANDNIDLPIVTGTTPTSPITLNEDTQQPITLLGTTPVGTINYFVVTQPGHGSLSDIDQVLDKVVYTPSQNYYGTDSFSFKATNEDGDSSIYTVNLYVNIQIDDEPILPTLNDYVVQEDVTIDNIPLPEAEDADGIADTITYDLEIVSAPDESTFDKNSHWNAATRIISGWTPEKDDVGKLKLRLIAKDTQDTLNVPSRDTDDFIIFVYPRQMCEDAVYSGGNNLGITIEDPEDDKEFGPGDTINIKAIVENKASDDKKVIVKAVLYDLDRKKIIVDTTSDYEKIRVEDGEETFNLELQIPLVTDDEYGGDYVLYVKAYEKGEEDTLCISDMVDVDVSREDHEVIIQSMIINPSIVNSGDSVDITVNILNVGERREDGVYVVLKNPDLDITLTSETRDYLGTYDEGIASYQFRFKDVKIPIDVETGEYGFEDSYVVFSDDYNNYLESPTYNLKKPDSQITVEGEITLTAMIAVSNAEETSEGFLTVPITITNAEGLTGLTVGLTNIDWAEDVNDKSIALGKGESTTVYFELELNDEAEEGTNSFTVQLKSNGAVVDSTARTLDVSEDMVSGGFPWGTVLFVVGDIVLIVVIIFFIKLIFSSRKGRIPRVKEVKL